jgi:hypothetical protein
VRVRVAVKHERRVGVRVRAMIYEIERCCYILTLTLTLTLESFI